MKAIFLLLVWLEPFACGIQIRTEMHLISTEPSSARYKNHKINFWKRLDKTQPFSNQLKRLDKKWPFSLPVLQERKSSKSSLSSSYNRSPSRKKQEAYIELGTPGIPAAEMRKRRNTLESIDTNAVESGLGGFSVKNVSDPYYVYGSVRSTTSPRAVRKAATELNFYDRNFSNELISNYRPFNYEVYPDTVTPILFLDDIAISPLLLDENSKYESSESNSLLSNHILSKSNTPTRPGTSKIYFNHPFQEKPYQYADANPSSDLATLETMNPEIHFPPIDNDSLIPVYNMKHVGQKLMVPKENELSFQRNNLAFGKISKNKPYLSGATRSGEDIIPVPFHLINWPHSLKVTNFGATETLNDGTKTNRPPLKSLKIPQILKLENQLSEDSNSFQSVEMEMLHKLINYQTKPQSMTPTKQAQPWEVFSTRGSPEVQTIYQHSSDASKTPKAKGEKIYNEAFNKEQPYLTSSVVKMLHSFKPILKDLMPSNSDLNLNNSISFRTISEFLRNSTQKKLPNAWIIVLQKRKDNKLDFYHKILYLLGNINKKMGNVNVTSSPDDGLHLTSQREVGTTTAIKPPSKDSNATEEKSTPYSAPLREFILNQIFLLSESLETLKEFEDKAVSDKTLGSKFNADGKLLRGGLDKQKQAIGVNGWHSSQQKPTSRKKRSTSNITHFDAVDNILSFRLLEHALEDEEDETLLYLLKELLIETKESLQSVARQLEVPILNFPSELPNSVTKLDSAHISTLKDRKVLLKKIHLLDHLNVLNEFHRSQEEFIKSAHNKAISLPQWVARQKRSTGNENATNVQKDSAEKPAKPSVGPTFTLSLITANETESKTSSSTNSLPLTSSVNNTTLKIPKLKSLNLAYGIPSNMQNSANEEKLEKRMLTMESDDSFPNDFFHRSLNDLPDLFSNSFVTQNRTHAEMEFRKRMLSVSNTTDILNRNSTSPLNVFYEDADILVSEVPEHFLSDGNTTIRELKSLLDGNGSFVSEVYIIKDNGCRTLKIVHDKYLEESCNFNDNNEGVGLNDTPYFNAGVKHNVINTGFPESHQTIKPHNSEAMNFKTPEMHLTAFDSAQEIANSELIDKLPGAPNSQALNSELLDIISRMPEEDLENSELLEHQLLNDGFSDDIMNAYYFNPNSYIDMTANSFVPDLALETDKLNFKNDNFNSITKQPHSHRANKLTNSMIDNVEEGTTSHIALSASSTTQEDNKVNKENHLDSDTAKNGTELEMSSSEVSQRAGRKVTDNGSVLPNDLANILKLISNSDSSLNVKDKELTHSLNAGIDILSNVESLLSRLGQEQVTVNSESSLNPLITRSAKTTATAADNEFLRNISVNPLFNGIRVDSEKQINIELTLDNNKNAKEDDDDEIEATTKRPTTESSVLEKLLNFRNTDFGKPTKSQGKASSEDKLFFLPASFLKQLDGFDYGEFEPIVSHKFTKNNDSKPNINKNSDKYFLEKLLENKDKLLDLLSNLSKDNKTAEEEDVDSEDITHLKKLIKDKAEPVIDSIIATFFKPLIRPKPKTSESLQEKNITEISEVNFNSSLSPGNLEIFILRYDGGGGGVQTLLKEYKDFTKDLLRTSGRKVAAQVGNNTDIKTLNETTSHESNQTGIHDEVFVGTTTLNNGTNIKVTITINSNENKQGNSSIGGGYHKEILLFGKDKPSKTKERYEEDDERLGGNDPTDAYSSQNDLYNPILAANKPANLRSNQNFGFIRLPRKTVLTTEKIGKLKNSDFSLSLTNRKFSSRMQQLVPSEDYISQLMPPLPKRKLIPHYQFPIVLPLEAAATKIPKWVWMKTDVNSASSHSIGAQAGIESSLNSAPKTEPESKEISAIDLGTPARKFFGENSNLDKQESISEMDESASNDVSWLW